MINTITNNAGTAAGLIKEGPGRLILSATNDYDGGTQVKNGILVVRGSLADASMTISAGTVNGSGTLTFNVAGATIDKIVMTGGTLTATGLTVNVNGSLTQPEYVLVDATGGGAISGTFAGLTGAPGYTLDYGTANQVKLVGPGGGSAYDTWATGGELFDGDANGDGVKDGLAFLLGAANPSENAIGRLPTVSESGGGLILNFNCLPIAARGTATLKVAHSNTLASWTATTDEVPDANDPTPDNNVTFVVDTVSEAPLNKVTATIGSGAAAAGKLFGRLEASQP
jgi:autotransporter-associated beta strand protein